MKSLTNIELKYFCYFSLLLLVGSAMTIFLDQNAWLLFSVAILFFFLAVPHPVIIFYILIASIPWSVEYAVADYFATDLPDEFIMLLISFSIIVFLFFSKQKINWQGIFSPLLLLLFLQFAWIVISALFSTNAFVSYKFLLAKSWYLLAFVISPVILLNDRKKLLTTALIFSLSMIVCTMVVMYRHAWEGFTFG
ncbi:MAG: hypothetical protein ABR503_03795, partial [Chitinophagaceae bacterium]